MRQRPPIPRCRRSRPGRRRRGRGRAGRPPAVRRWWVWRAWRGKPRPRSRRPNLPGLRYPSGWPKRPRRQTRPRWRSRRRPPGPRHRLPRRPLPDLRRFPHRRRQFRRRCPGRPAPPARSRSPAPPPRQRAPPRRRPGRPGPARPRRRRGTDSPAGRRAAWRWRRSSQARRSSRCPHSSGRSPRTWCPMRRRGCRTTHRSASSRAA